MMDTLTLAGELTIYRAAELKHTVLDALAATDTGLEVDLAGVTEMDTAGLQVLMVAKKAAARRELPLRLVGHSPAVLEVFELLNVAAHFGDPLVIAERGSNES
jgi:anti-sigma B factor antagonist